MRKLKKIAVMAMATVMAISMTACGGGKKEDNNKIVIRKR